jgi:hypothetical protein
VRLCAWRNALQGKHTHSTHTRMPMPLIRSGALETRADPPVHPAKETPKTQPSTPARKTGSSSQGLRHQHKKGGLIIWAHGAPHGKQTASGPDIPTALQQPQLQRGTAQLAEPAAAATARHKHTQKMHTYPHPQQEKNTRASNPTPPSLPHSQRIACCEQHQVCSNTRTTTTCSWRISSSCEQHMPHSWKLDALPQLRLCPCPPRAACWLLE